MEQLIAPTQLYFIVNDSISNDSIYTYYIYFVILIYEPVFHIIELGRMVNGRQCIYYV